MQFWFASSLQQLHQRQQQHQQHQQLQQQQQLQQSTCGRLTVKHLATVSSKSSNKWNAQQQHH